MLTQLFGRDLNAHVVCDAVAAILSLEEENQRRLAVEANQDPEPLRVRVYRDMSAPISDWVNTDADIDLAPIVNVRIEREDTVGGNVIEQQRCTVRVAIECFAVGVSTAGSTGFSHAEEASLASIRSVSAFVRKVVMAGENTYLGLRGVVTKRWIESLSYIPIDHDQTPSAQHVRACKILLSVDTYEVSPQIESVPLASIRVRLVKNSDGQVLASSVFLAEE